jgi:hypothetical protein
MAESQKSLSTMFLLLTSIVASVGNSITFKKLLNKFSAVDGSHNYEFFVSQFTTMLYLIPSVIMVVYRYQAYLKLRSQYSEEVKSAQSTFFVMGIFDAASSTLGAIGGALTPGQLQTLINQTIIPLTITFSKTMIGSKFTLQQIMGATLVFAGACFAGIPYFFAPATATTSNVAIVIFFVSIIPAALSNVYKEKTMKNKNLDVYITTTFVSIWQEILGFVFLPALCLKTFGGLSKHDMLHQMSDGYQCFLGYNPSPLDQCDNATALFLAYVFINWILNVNLLMLTKTSSAVMLVVANSLALPITNVAFSIPGIMGADAEPFTVPDLIGLVAVVVGFLIYSSFGLSSKFTLTAGPPGQMAYHEVNSNTNPMVLTAANALFPRKLAHFLVALHGGSNVKGSFTGALSLARKVVAVLEGYVVTNGRDNSSKKDDGGGGGVEDSFDEEEGLSYLMTPRGRKGEMQGGIKGDGASRISPTSFFEP